MKIEPGVPSLGHLPPADVGNWPGLTEVFRRLPNRLRDKRFWHVQALVLLATVPHYAIETLGFTNPFETLHGLTITLYILPLLYAALNFGWEGAAMTALWTVFLTSPSMWIWHRSGFHWFTEVGQLAVTLPAGMLVAWRVDRETRERLRAEDTSASLRLLNEVGEILSHTLEVEQQLPEVLRRLQTGLSLESVSLSLEPESGEDDPTLIGTPAPLPEGDARDGRTLVVPLFGETGTLGSLEATAAGVANLTDSQVELISTVAQQVRVAVENARLYRQRQESLQSYARQVTQAQEDERLRIARELHHETAQELVLLSRKLEQLKGRVGSDQVQDIDYLLDMTRGTIQAVRRYSRDLRPSVLDDLGLQAAIEVVVEDTGHQLLKGAPLEVTGNQRRLDGGLELALFRIAQEALRNVEKHAGATSATVKLDFGRNEISLAVSDDGQGFSAARNMSELIRSGKLGLVGMKERAELVGATFELRSDPEGGTTVSVRAKAASR